MKEHRYSHLYELDQKIKNIIEIGVCHGETALNMLRPGMRYYGFDLFEDGFKPEPGTVIDKFTHALPIAEVQAKLDTTGAEVKLIQGDSIVTIPAFTAGCQDKFDLIFIDGGHDFETVLSDWLNIQPLIGPNTIILFDDYFTNGYKVDGGNWGINGVIHTIDKNIYHTEVLPNSDQYDDPWDDLCLVKVTRI